MAAHLIRATAAGEKDVAGILQGKDGARVTLLLDDGSETVIEEKKRATSNCATMKTCFDA